MDHYLTLGVSKTATQDEIKKAYRKLAMEHHPDRGGDHARFAAINEAYDILKDPAKRADYDNPPQTHNFRSDHFNTANFDDLFSTFFSHMRQPPIRNKDIRVNLTLSLEDVLSGKDLLTTYNINSGQTTANIRIHQGVEHGEAIRFKGLGDNALPQSPRGDLVVVVSVLKHNVFDRDGKHLKTTVPISVFDLILGSKVEVTLLSGNVISVNIPKGTQPGTILSVSGHGLPNIRTGSTGNLYVALKGIVPKVEDPEILERIKNLNDAISKGT